MSSDRNGGYEAGYEACDCFWGSEPGSYVRKLMERVSDCSGWSVLDVGCGEGKNAAFFAEKGANVVAIEISQRALDHAKVLHPSTNIEWKAADATKQIWPREHFDIIIAYGLFHCLSSEDEIVRLQSSLADSTKSGGYHVVCSFNDRDQDLKGHPGFNPCLMSHAFYRRLYRGWSIEFASDDDLYETHPHNNILHHHSLTRLLARKKS